VDRCVGTVGSVIVYVQDSNLDGRAERSAG